MTPRTDPDAGAKKSYACDPHLDEDLIRSEKIAISPPLLYQDELRRRVIITLNMSRVVQHVWDAVRQENTEKLMPVFDRDHPLCSKADMRTW